MSGNEDVKKTDQRDLGTRFDTLQKNTTEEKGCKDKSLKYLGGKQLLLRKTRNITPRLQKREANR